jgi:acid stress-induced BolA-like protein IbaG/YrbA
MIADEIKKIIEGSVNDATVYVLDPMHDGQHLQAIVISPVFNGIPLVQQHQMVMKPLSQAFAQSVHALGLKTFTPEKWDSQVKSKYGL